LLLLDPLNANGLIATSHVKIDTEIPFITSVFANVTTKTNLSYVGFTKYATSGDVILITVGFIVVIKKQTSSIFEELKIQLKFNSFLVDNKSPVNLTTTIFNRNISLYSTENNKLFFSLYC
jgi:hypothetical protein